MLSFFSQLFLLIKFTYAFQTGSAGNNVAYILDENNLTIYGFGNMYDFSEGSTPWYENRTQIISVTILPNITSIGEYSFQACSNLASVIISDDVTTINSHAFHECSSLETIILPNNITFIGSLTFGSCSKLKTVKLPEKLTSISSFMFNSCKKLKTIKISSEKLIGILCVDQHQFFSLY